MPCAELDFHPEKLDHLRNLKGFRTSLHSPLQPDILIENTPANLSSLARKKLFGRFDTPRPIAQAITDWALRSVNELVLEPSVGGGVFIRSAAARMIALGCEHPFRRIFACDIDSEPCEEAKSKGLPAANVHHGDFLHFSPNRLFTAIIGNPPYVSLRRTDLATRSHYFSQASKKGFNEKKGSLWAHFVIKAHSYLERGGRLAFLLPEAVLYTDYGRKLLDWAAPRFSRCSLISIRERCFVSEGTNERVVILLLDGCGESPSSGVAINEFLTVHEALKFLAKIDPQANPTGEHINGHVIPQAISNNAHDIYAELEANKGITTLGNLAKINIGVVTGANSFFVLSEKDRSDHRLRKSSLIKCLTKFSDCKNSFTFTQGNWKESIDNAKRAWLFYPSPSTIDKASLSYLKTFPENLIKSNKTFGKRSSWYRPIVPPTPDAFLRYMGSDGPKLALNEARCTSTNTIHHILFKKPLPLYRKRAIALAIQSTISQVSAEFVGRSYGSGVLKLEPSDCKKILIPIPQCFPKEINSLWKQCVALGETGLNSRATSLIDDWIYRQWTGTKLPSLETLNELRTTARKRREG